ncbi:hypothetical protein PMAYCL1PPCAC_02578, partial [Pristionchus mayeri]
FSLSMFSLLESQVAASGYILCVFLFRPDICHRGRDDLLYSTTRWAMSSCFSRVSRRTEGTGRSGLSTGAGGSSGTRLTGGSGRSGIRGWESVLSRRSLGSTGSRGPRWSLNTSSSDGIISGRSLDSWISWLSWFSLGSWFSDSTWLAWSSRETGCSWFSRGSSSTWFSLRSTRSRRTSRTDDTGEGWFRIQRNVQSIETWLARTTRKTIDSRLSINSGWSSRAGRALQLHARRALSSSCIGVRVSRTVSSLSDSSSLALDDDDVLPDATRLYLECVHSLLQSRLCRLQLIVEEGNNDDKTCKGEEGDEGCPHGDLSRDPITRRGLGVLHHWVFT